MIYTHWLVTKGEEPFLKQRRSFTPIALESKAKVTLHRLRTMVLERLEAIATCLLPDDASAVHRIQTVADAASAVRLTDLWLREVRLERAGVDHILPNEVGYTWTLFNAADLKVPPTWQGPADGVISADMPTTVWDAFSKPAKFEVID